MFYILLGPNYLYLDKDEKKELHSQVSEKLFESYHYVCVGRNLAFNHLGETFLFQVSDIEVSDENLSQWVKTSGKALRKFYKIDPTVTVVKIPKSDGGVNSMVNFSLSGRP